MRSLSKPWVAFLIGGLVCLVNYWRIEIGSNQEIYMALAKWWAMPEWIPGSFYFSDPPGTRIGFVFPLFPFWKMFSFEAVAMGGSFVNLFFLGGAWFLFIKELREINLTYTTLLHLTLFSGLGFLSFYAGEWMFGPAEPKTIAYFFGLLGLWSFFKGGKYLPFILLGIAAYSHVLVAGWMLAILLLELLYQKNWKRFALSFITFLISVIPLLIYLVSEYFQAGLSSFKGADEIFIASLNNHLRPWTVTGRESRFYLGVIYSFLACAGACYRLKKITDERLKLVYRLSIYSFFIPTILLCLAPWEWFNPFLKLFPFRLTLLQKCFFLIGLVTELTYFIERKQSTGKIIKIIAILILILSGAARINKNVVKKLSEKDPTGLTEISSYLEENFAPGTHILYLDTETVAADDVFDSLTRKSRMDVYFVNKFIPFSPGKIIEWQRRLELIEAIRKDHSQLNRLKADNVKVIISRSRINSPDLRLRKEIEGFRLYEFI